MDNMQFIRYDSKVVHLVGRYATYSTEVVVNTEPKIDLIIFFKLETDNYVFAICC